MNDNLLHISLNRNEDGTIDTTVNNSAGAVIEKHSHSDLYLLLSLIIRVVTIFFHRKDGE
jgi:hypothetical protein